MIDKKEVISILNTLQDSVTEASQVSDCKFDLVFETVDIPTKFHSKKEPSGWKNIKLEIRWYNQQKETTFEVVT